MHLPSRRVWLLLLFALLPLTAPARAATAYMIRAPRWTAADERAYGEFITGLGDSGCRSVDACLRGGANPFRGSDPDGFVFRSDCADLPYVLRFYYAWKRGLPFSYVRDVSPGGRASDIRYSPRGNVIDARRDILSGADALAVLSTLRDAVSSATYRIDPDLETPFAQDFYSPAIQPGAIRPGTVIYDPNGHLAVVYRIERDGRIRYIDAHPDNSLTRGFYDLRFVRSSPGMGAGFKNWRPITLEDARREDGILWSGHDRLTANADLADFSNEQYYGTGLQPDDASDWKTGGFRFAGAAMGYYDYVRARPGGGLSFDPVGEIADMVASNCADLSDRADAVNEALRQACRTRRSPIACHPTSTAPTGTGRPIPPRRAMPGSKRPSRRCATAPNGSWPCGGPAAPPLPIAAAISPGTCWRPMTSSGRLPRLLSPHGWAVRGLRI